MHEHSALDIAQHQLLRREYADSLRGFLKATESDPENWSAWFGAAQSAHKLGQATSACTYMERALRLNASDASLHAVYAPILRAAGAHEAANLQLARALELDPDYAEAFSLLADAQRQAGALDKAFHNYDAGVKALARRIVKTLQNSESSPIVKHSDMTGHVWVECAMFGAFWMSSNDGITNLAWPTDATALEEERTERHRGLYYVDHKKWLSVTRIFLPNYFATFRERLRAEPIFEFLVGNQGTIHKLRGDEELAEQYFLEATTFSRR